MSAVVRASGIGVTFLFDRQRRVVTPTLARLRRRGTEVAGLRGVSFSIDPGEGVALLGASGAGKTTLLRLLAGVIATDSGHLQVRGRVASLLSNAAGLMPSLTGRENASLLAVLAGMSRESTRGSLEEIRDRSGLESVFELPVSSYSQGMKARLTYSVWAQIEPAVILLDEVHEALDHEYRTLVAEDIRRRKEVGAIVVAAGHDHGMLDMLCERALLLHGGAILADGRFADVLGEYLDEDSGKPSPELGSQRLDVG